MSFPRYPSYKDSGVEWLGAVPEHWDVKLVRNLASIVNGYPFDSTLFDPAEGSPLIRIRDLNKAEAETFYKGDFVDAAAITSDDVLIGMDGDFNVGRWRGDGRALLNQRMCCVRGNSKVLTRLLEHFLPIRLKAINDVTYATTVKHLASSQVEKTVVAIPPDIAEQTQIAAFLDRETAKIDALVAEQRRLMELLKEKRQAVISHAVTKGLNPNAPMKPSGIEWLGDVPEHWDVRKLTSIAVLESGHTPSRQRPDYWIEEDCVIPWFTLADVGFLRDERNTVITGTSQKISQIGIQNSSARLLPIGTVLLSRTASVGFSGITAIAVAVSQDFAAWICAGAIDSPYLLSCLRAMKPEFRRLMMGSTHQTIYMPDIEAFRVPVPPKVEQKAIAKHVQRMTFDFDALTTESQRAINLLQERRTALISAAVTGQIDVRHLAL